MSDALPNKPLTIPVPANETERLAALHRYKILDTPPEAAFDRITALATRLFNIPIALISLVDESRAWFKSCIGFGAHEVSRDDTLCSFAVLMDDPLIIPDTRQDERFACNPFVQSEPGLRFYAGAPLLSHDGFNLGTLCLLDSQPRDSLTAEQQATLIDLAAMVVDELELRLAAHKIAQVDTALLEITQGVATVTGEAFFDALVQHFAKVLDADYAYIGLIEGDNPKMIRTIVTCAHGQIVDNLEYPLRETPCWEVIEQRKICCYPRNVQAHFPNAPLLKPLSVESYVAIPFFDSSGTPLGLLGVMDGKPLENVQLAESLLTIFALRIATELERQQTEVALRESQERLRFMLNASQIGEWDLDLTTQPHTAHRSLRHDQIFGYEALLPEWSYEIFLTHVHPEDRAAVNEKFQQTLSASTVWNFECRIIHPDQSVHWIWVRSSVYCDPNGTPTRLLGMVVDITDRKQAEEALRESEGRFRTLADQMSQFAWMADANGWIFWYNRRWFEYTGTTLEQMQGWGWQQVHHPEHVDRVVEYFRHCIEIGEQWEDTFPLRRNDGTYRWFLSRAIPVRDAAGNILRWFGTNTDITERLQAEQEREQLLEREQAARSDAEAANRVKDEFLAVLSHELRSPLNPILGWTRLLQKGKLDPARKAEALKTIERNAKLQSQLIEDLLDISRIMQGKLTLTATPVSLAFVISAALETVRLAAEAKNIKIMLDLSPMVDPISGDAARLQQVVWNLLTNAVKFTPNGGQVTVELGQFDQLAQIRVIDSGKGIAPEFLPYVFEYFRQADSTTTRKFGGLGLGLAIVRQIVEMHGGTVKAESLGEDQGAIFTVQLPILQQTVLAVSEPSRAEAGNTENFLSNLQILVVDDDADTREFQAFLLEQSGARVITATSGLEALQVLDQFIPDVLVSDVGMAQMDGYMLIQQIRSRPPDRGGTIPAIAVTAYARDFDQQKALQAGFQAHITKPVEPDVLVKAIINLLDHETVKV